MALNAARRHHRPLLETGVRRSGPTSALADFPSTFGLHLLGVLGLLMLAAGGYVAGSPVVQSLLPVNPIVLGVIFVATTVAIRPRGEPAPWSRVWVPALLLVSMSGGWLYSTGSAYAVDKSLQMATLVPLSMWGGMVVLRHQRARRLWLGATIIWAGVVAGLILWAPDQVAAESSRLSLEGGNTIATGLASGAAIIALSTLALGVQRWRIPMFILAGGFSALMLGTGSRGPLLAVVVALIVTLIAAPAKRRSWSRWLWLSLVCLAGFVVYFWIASRGYLVERLSSLDDNSAQTRVLLYERAWSEVFSHPVGAGWGSLEGIYDVNRLSGYTYPHNIILELATEGGWLGIAGLLLVLVTAWRTQRKRQGDAVELSMLALLVFFFVEALVSGDLPSHRVLWVMVGACSTTLVPSTLGLERDAAQKKKLSPNLA